MREIGGYIELDTYNNKMLHEKAIALNCGRNCLAYLIETKGIRKIWLPYFLCNSVSKLCSKYAVKINYYHINYDWTIEKLELSQDEWLYCVNYYGQLSKEYIQDLVKKYSCVILDNSQAYFEMPINGVDTIYTCRKFFGVSDGAFLYTDKHLSRKLLTDESFFRIKYILGRFERTAQEFYRESVENNEFFSEEPIKEMSKLTRNLLHAVDHEFINTKRTNNFAYLNDKLKDINQLKVRNVDGAFMYPLMLDDAQEIKQKLLKEKIYIPTLWPNVLDDVPNDWWEYRLANNILPLPVDQRYGQEEMDYVVSLINKSIKII